MKYNPEILEKYVNDGLIEKTNHPTLPISIYNYSRETQYKGLWDNITRSCRALILDADGNVVAKSFNKFFNIEEHTPGDLPQESFKVYDKMDGSLIILFRYNDEWIFASKGSFSSDQANLAKKIFEKVYSYDLLNEKYVYVFELIGPSNRIVVEYPEDNLVLLSVVNTIDWVEEDIYNVENNNFVRTKLYDGINDYTTLKFLISNDKEGYVVKFKNGFRVKVKGEEYVRLHRILTNFSNVDIWEYLKDGKDINELLDRVPDEFDKWVKDTISDLKYHKYRVEERVGKTFDYHMYGKYGDKEPVTNRKEYAEWVLSQEKWMQPILFRMFDKKDYSDYLWTLVKPKYTKPLWMKNNES